MDIVRMWTQVIAPYVRARFGVSERGAALVEYALLVGLIAIVCMVAISVLGRGASGKLSTVGSAIATS